MLCVGSSEFVEIFEINESNPSFLQYKLIKKYISVLTFMYEAKIASYENVIFMYKAMSISIHTQCENRNSLHVHST